MWSVALYVSESWTIGESDKKDSWCYRRIFKISWREKITNDEVLRRAQEEKSFLGNLKARRAMFIGHILRLSLIHI